ncbi:hypothetical protein RKE29_01425 [Streptomyces sp. B1866]|uniref:hypothetical protein n=1 Tax=Streptomyces sp. B1866 TaxID=3075431 RepID=UPI002892767B|nr:hypothetical protein [Streptomyces sp. B1866]MDT3395321.1 hypothetical protein [Streptomyces sp. B1866]
MTALPTTRDALADLLTDAAQQVGTLLTAQVPAPGAPAGPFLTPLLGSLRATMPVLKALSSQLDACVDGPQSKSPAGLSTFASLVSATCQLLDATGEFIISAIESLCVRLGTGSEPDRQPPAGEDAEDYIEVDVAFTEEEWEEIQRAARRAGLEPDDFVAVAAITESALLRFAALCREIRDGLLSDAAYLRSGTDTDARLAIDSRRVRRLLGDQDGQGGAA